MAWSSGTEAPLPHEVHEKIEGALAGHSWLRPFPGLAVVTLTYDDERNEVLSKLVELGQSELTTVHILVSPPIPEGVAYGGRLSQDAWKQLNARTAGTAAAKA